MASEKVKLFSKIEIEIYSTVQGTLALRTDVPGNGMAQRFIFTMPSSNIVGGVPMRRTVTSRLPYNTQGHLVQAIVTPEFAGQIAIYRVRLWGRELPGGQWGWYNLPVIETPADFAPAELPIPRTPEEWSNAQLPIPPTPEEWSRTELPIPATPEEWRDIRLPIKPTPEVPDWADLEVDK